MNLALNIEQFDLPTKIEAMEQLWASLSSETYQPITPNWHQDVLQQRLQAVETGKSEFLDWQTAKARLRAIVQ